MHLVRYFDHDFYINVPVLVKLLAGLMWCVRSPLLSVVAGGYVVFFKIFVYHDYVLKQPRVVGPDAR